MILVLKGWDEERFVKTSAEWGLSLHSGNHAVHPKYPHIFRVTNKKLENGKSGLFSKGFLDWHCNSVFCPDPEEVVVLFGKKVLKEAPTTWADCTKMYYDLPETAKAELRKTTVTMSNIGNIKGNRTYTGSGELAPEDIIALDTFNFRTREGLMTGQHLTKSKQLPNGRWLIKTEKPLVRIHPVTKQEVFYFPFPHMSDFPLKQELVERLMEPKYLYTHHWEEGDVVISDQLATIHKRDATLEDENYERELYRTTFYYRQSDLGTGDCPLRNLRGCADGYKPTESNC